MKILVHSSSNAKNIRSSLGKVDYSYYFVLAGYLPALAELGEIITVADPEREVDKIFDKCKAANEACVFLCFAPPHLVPITLRCPTIPVLAWEFSTIPCEVWGDDPRCDWRVVFAHCGRVITLSNYAAALVRDAMGEDFPVFAIPTASYEAFADIAPVRPIEAAAKLKLHGYLFDSAAEARFLIDPPFPPVPTPDFGSPAKPASARLQELTAHQLAAVPPSQTEPEQPAVAGAPPRISTRKRISITVYYFTAWYREVLRDLLPAPLTRLVSAGGRFAYRIFRGKRNAHLPPPQSDHHLTLSGVVYASVLAPQDGRKNWQDLLTGFVDAFKDNPGATLFLKVPASAGLAAYPAMYAILSRFAPFKCRVIWFAGFLDDAEYRDLVRATTYYVNTSHCEGLCLPLMEFLSAGRPAIAPDHTAMADYIDSNIAFVLQASLEHNVWPFDKRDLFTTMRYRLDWESVVSAYRQSYSLAVDDDPLYGAMRSAAPLAMRDFCRLERVQAKLSQALGISAPKTEVPADWMVQA